MLALQLSAEQLQRLQQLLDELVKWNQAYNLTSITEPAQMLTHHLLDSLAVHADVVGTRVADVGTGAGFPGLPLAIVQSEHEFTLIDSNNKKIRFVTHAARALGLKNVRPVHARAESYRDAAGFDSVVARACAPLPELLRWARPLCRPGTRVLAMKGKRSAEDLTGVSADWQVQAVRNIDVPGLDAERHVIVLTRGTLPA